MPAAWWAEFKWLFFGALAALVAAFFVNRGDQASTGKKYKQGLDQGRQESEARVDREKQRNQGRAERIVGWLDRMADDGGRPVD